MKRRKNPPNLASYYLRVKELIDVVDKLRAKVDDLPFNYDQSEVDSVEGYRKIVDKSLGEAHVGLIKMRDALAPKKANPECGICLGWGVMNRAVDMYDYWPAVCSCRRQNG